MKKFAILMVLILGLFTCCVAEDVPKEEILESDNFRYVVLADNSAEIVGYDGRDEKEIIIPNELDGHPVMAVRSNPFYHHKDYKIFVSQDHPYLATIDGVLFGKSDRKLICYPTSLNSTSYQIPEGIQSIGKWAFSNCSNLTKITIPDSVTSIEDCAFYRCSSLKSLMIPNSVTSIGRSAFSDCSSLTGITIPNGVTSISNGIFWGCSSLKSITIPNSVTSIGARAFWGCDSLTSITLPNSIASIDDGAFYRCSNLTKIIIPDSLINLGSDVFGVCPALKEINISNTNPSFTIVDGIIYSKSLDTLVYYPANKTNLSFTIPDSVTSIGNTAFSSCSNLTSIVIPDSVTSIGELAFAYCNSLTSITIPDSVTSIGELAFEKCISLTSIMIPDSVISIGDSAFPKSNKDFKAAVIEGSYAETYCREHKIPYKIYDPNLEDAPTDWLTGN